MIAIEPFTPGDRDDVVALILSIQRDEFGFAITANDQPDLLSVPEFYQQGTGGFWVARSGDKIVGTIALKDIENGQAALRKMFVLASYRGAELAVGARLLAELIGHARRQRLREVFLGTTDKFRAAHRFYEKNGFRRIEKDALPAAFPFMAVDTRFYTRAP